LEKACVFATTQRGLEAVAASHIAELGFKAVHAPLGMQGIVVVYCAGDPEEAARIIQQEVPEAERVLPIYAEVSADLDSICAAVKKLASKLSRDESFAVRTTRRGSHGFTSLDVNVRAGACIQEVTGNPVNLTYPDKVFWVEIVGERAYISLTPGNMLHRKKYPGKPSASWMLSKTIVVQMPYLGDLQGARKIGVRLGRAAQTFELAGLVVAPYKPVDVAELEAFLDGLLEGKESRLRIQRRAYERKVRPVPLTLYDMYQHIRAARARGHGIIVTSTKGRYIGEVAGDLAELYKDKKKVHVVIGSRESVPAGVYRFADLIIDVAPGLTLSTDTALTAIITAIVDVVLTSSLRERSGAH